ncbi:MAG TPA: thiosulfate oxidation carrier protein SoxY [Chromatiales bacterium]|nr:thiosulfate oxidation carrier protein SoxY [Chromatiales bacterium]
MTTDIKRRIFLKGSVAAGMLGAAASTGLLIPQAAFAEWPKDAFATKKLDEAVKALLGSGDMAESGDIKIKAPDIAENGAVVPVTVQTDMEGVTNIAILAPENNTPLVAAFELGKNTLGFVSTRIKMGKTGDVIAVVKAGDKIYTAKKQVKVTIGGCGG